MMKSRRSGKLTPVKEFGIINSDDEYDYYYEEQGWGEDDKITNKGSNNNLWMTTVPPHDDEERNPSPEKDQDRRSSSLSKKKTNRRGRLLFSKKNEAKKKSSVESVAVMAFNNDSLVWKTYVETSNPTDGKKSTIIRSKTLNHKDTSKTLKKDLAVKHFTPLSATEKLTSRDRKKEKSQHGGLVTALATETRETNNNRWYSNGSDDKNKDDHYAMQTTHNDKLQKSSKKYWMFGKSRLSSAKNNNELPLKAKKQSKNSSFKNDGDSIQAPKTVSLTDSNEEAGYYLPKRSLLDDEVTEFSKETMCLTEYTDGPFIIVPTDDASIVYAKKFLYKDENCSEATKKPSSITSSQNAVAVSFPSMKTFQDKNVSRSCNKSASCSVDDETIATGDSYNILLQEVCNGVSTEIAPANNQSFETDGIDKTLSNDSSCSSGIVETQRTVWAHLNRSADKSCPLKKSTLGSHYSAPSSSDLNKSLQSSHALEPSAKKTNSAEFESNNDDDDFVGERSIKYYAQRAATSSSSSPDDDSLRDVPYDHVTLCEGTSQLGCLVLNVGLSAKKEPKIITDAMVQKCHTLVHTMG